MYKTMTKSFLPILICLIPALLVVYFFISAKFILLDDHEVYRLFFREINFFTAIPDDWLHLYRFRPFYWLLRQLQSIFFGIEPSFWYGFNWLLFATSLIALYLFFTNLGFKKYLAILLTWAGVLGHQSIGSWMAYGIQEGLGLTLISISLLFLSKYLAASDKKNIYASFFFYCLAFLTKESFAFLLPLFMALLLVKYKTITRDFYRDCGLYLLGLIALLPVIMILTWRSHAYRSAIFGSSQAAILQIDNLVVFFDYIKNNPQIVFSFLLFMTFSFILLYTSVTHRWLLFKIALLSLFGIFLQIIIYSFTEYIAPHYIQPFSLAVIVSLALVLLFASFKHFLLTAFLLCMTMPNVFLATLQYVNGHNYHSRMIYEIEQKIATKAVKTIVLVGHRSYDHEKIFSFFKRIHYLYPDKEIFFYQYNGQKNVGFLDVSSEVVEINAERLVGADLLINFSPNFVVPENFQEYHYYSQPISKTINYMNVWYVEAPSVYYQ